MLISEAKEKWCAYIRLTVSDGIWYDNRGNNGGNKIGPCLNTDCACWKNTGYDELAKERTGHCGLIKI